VRTSSSPLGPPRPRRQQELIAGDETGNRGLGHAFGVIAESCGIERVPRLAVGGPEDDAVGGDGDEAVLPRDHAVDVVVLADVDRGLAELEAAGSVVAGACGRRRGQRQASACDERPAQLHVPRTPGLAARFPAPLARPLSTSGL